MLLGDFACGAFPLQLLEALEGQCVDIALFHLLPVDLHQLERGAFAGLARGGGVPE